MDDKRVAVLEKNLKDVTASVQQIEMS